MVPHSGQQGRQAMAAIKLKKVRTINLSQEALIDALPRAAGVLRKLMRENKTIVYRPFLVAIGLLKPNARWEAWHRNWASAVLYALSATERVTQGRITLEYERVLDQRGMPGIGLKRQAFLMRTAG